VLARPISAGGDTDTIASLTGQLAGTVVRATGVPHDLFGGVEGSDEIFQIARRFAKFVIDINPSRDALQMQLRLVLLCVIRALYSTQAILAETARTRMEWAICCLARRRAAGWKNLPLSGSPQS
jgi:hypothetical protein